MSRHNHGFPDRTPPFWQAQLEQLEATHPAAKPPFFGANADFDFQGWSNELAAIAKVVEQEILKFQELLERLANYTPPEPRGFMGEQDPHSDAFDGLEEEAYEVISGLVEKNDITHVESAPAVNQPDAYSEFNNSFDWLIDDGAFPYILDMAA
ncbi:hypothetical protein HX870_16685 [Pseudomonas gingeri]|uniref:Uncharacterized protein n=1 Tax=Pseudomonas gingeri TaxID=117681 RepID=A0A7Y7XAB4_9PSED|nr:hypothetical protein [Pseudomonas gingeri]NWA27409.1 hypothetical protein [Pseudomonas gingeri]NWB96026.1 hypothetical protein [Pseudomonas gingeri]NWD69241.1 hypothetical protein [Pseudomonas gingeri]NWD77083.1 hypothetical protein [Pseudomonas gingeri]